MITTITGDKNQVVRRKAIMNLLKDDAPMKVSALSDCLNVSAVTIRKDLDMLESVGLISRIHGGAVKIIPMQSNPDYEERKKQRSAEKIKVAKAAADLVSDGESLIVNVGSTSAFFCEELKSKNNLVVVTNALHIATELLPHKNITTFLLGGRLDGDMKITTGDDATDQLSKYKVDWLFMGMDGVDIEAGVTSYNHLEDSLMRQMIAQAKRRVLIVDDSKIGKVTFARVANVTDFEYIVTNYAERNEAQYEALRALGVQVIIA